GRGAFEDGGRGGWSSSLRPLTILVSPLGRELRRLGREVTRHHRALRLPAVLRTLPCDIAPKKRWRRAQGALTPGPLQEGRGERRSPLRQARRSSRFSGTWPA